MKYQFFIKATLAAALVVGVSAPIYASETQASSSVVKRTKKKATKKKASTAPKTNANFEGTVDGVDVKVYLNINSSWTGQVTGYYKMGGAKYSLKGEFVGESRIRLVEGYDDGVWNVEIGFGGGTSRPYCWMTGKTNSGGQIDLMGPAF